MTKSFKTSPITGHRQKAAVRTKDGRSPQRELRHVCSGRETGRGRNLQPWPGLQRADWREAKFQNKPVDNVFSQYFELRLRLRQK